MVFALIDQSRWCGNETGMPVGGGGFRRSMELANRKGPGLAVAFEDDGVIVRLGERSVTFPASEDAETGVLVVDLDSAAFFDPPHEEEEVALDILRRMTEAIEEAADAEEIEVEFA